jgi:hypothetical protein
MYVFAAEPVPHVTGTIGGVGLGPFGNISFTSGTQAMGKFTGAISAIIGLLTVVAAIWFLFQFTIGGFSWITAGGEKNKLTEARERLTNAFIGLFIVVAGWGVLALVGQFFGWTTILAPDSVINLIKFQ